MSSTSISSMKCFLLLMAFSVPLVLGTSVITLMDGDVSRYRPCQNKDVLACQKAKVNIDAIINNNPLNFPPNITMRKTRTSVEDTGTKVIQLKGIGKHLSLGLITITTDNDVILSIDTAYGRKFDLVNCGPDCYLWRTINATFSYHLDFSLPGLNRTSLDRTLDPAIAELLEESRQSNEQVEITIKLYYTPALSANTPNLRAFMERQIIETNLVMQKSNIPITLRALCSELMNVREGGTGYQFLKRGERYFSTFDRLYDGADIAILLTFNCAPDACGWASTINVINPIGGQPIRFAWVPMLGAPSYIFAHELGHLLGGEHNREQLGCGFNCPRTAYGYLIRRYSTATVMAYAPPGWKLIPYYSTSAFGYSTGEAIGTVVDDVRSTIMSVRIAVSRLGNDQCRNWCFDLNSFANCNYWRGQGFCQESYVEYMRTNCAFTCGFCI